MTSRSINQEARAYQSAHGVPYTEALRRVRAGRESQPSEADQPLTFMLGTGLFPATGLTPEKETPLRWTPGLESLPGDGSGSLCVYGHRDNPASMSLYLSALVRTILTDRSVVVFTERPDLFPSSENITFADPAVVQAIMQNTEGPEGSPYGSAERAHEYFSFEDSDFKRVFVYDLSPCSNAHDEYLENLLDCNYAALLYSSTDLDSKGNPKLCPNPFVVPEDNPRFTANEVTVFLGPMMAEGHELNNWVEHREHGVRLTLKSSYTAHSFVG